MLEKNAIIVKAFDLIKNSGWANFSLTKLSKKEKISLTDLKKIFNSKNSILDEFSRMIDEEVEKRISFEDFNLSSTKDNLFELIMIRFELLSPYKDSLKSILLTSKNNPMILKKISKNVLNSLDFYLELTNSYSESPKDFFKKNIIFFIYAYVFKIWLDDNSKELSKTMAELDKLLSLSEKFLKKINSLLPF